MTTDELLDTLEKSLPRCLLSDTKGERTVRNFIDAAEHEMALHDEGQDGCCTAAERRECAEFIGYAKNLSTLNGLPRQMKHKANPPNDKLTDAGSQKP